MIALIDYGIGNLRSVEKALSHVGADVVLTSDPAVILRADKVVLPGVGAFGDGMEGLQTRKLLTPIHKIIQRGTPFLGICLGMQLLFESSAELGSHTGLGMLPGKVVRFPEQGQKIPHTGWNQLDLPAPNPLTEGLTPGDYAYFNHSYYCAAGDNGQIIAQTDYGLVFPAIVGRDRLYGVQFHPEKSQHVGLHILRNFVERG
jgi:glutamine amidotransferase